MKHIFDEYGDFILQIIGGMGMVGLVIEMIRPGGLLRELVMALANSAV